VSGEFSTFRFGWDAPARLSTSTQVMQEATEMLPGESVYQPLPFPPTIVSGDSVGSSSSTSTSDDWTQFPGRLDLFCYQGDDVQVPLSFSDPSDWQIDMSTAAGWEWKSQIRVIHRYASTLVAEFITAAEYVPPVPTSVQPQGTTKVTLFLPRSLNLTTGCYQWDVQSVGPFSGPDYGPEAPADWPEGEPWPPDSQLKTWLWGFFTVLPRVTATDFLPPPVTSNGGGGGNVAVTTPEGWVVGPNGRVP